MTIAGPRRLAVLVAATSLAASPAILVACEDRTGGDVPGRDGSVDDSPSPPPRDAAPDPSS